MNRNDAAFDKISKYCGVCHRTTMFVIESTISTCLSCKTTFDDDAEDLFSEIIEE
jgi:ribosomal protein L37AE/L43A